MNTFWRTELINGYSRTPGYYEMLDAIKNSNLDEEIKYAVLAKITGYDSHEDENENGIRETILRTLTKNHKPMRVQEFTRIEKNPSAPLVHYTVQRVTSQLRFLVNSGLVKRTEYNTGRKIEVAPYKLIDEVIAYYQIVD